MLKGILGRRLSLDEPYKSISILRRIAIASGGRDDDDAILFRWCVGRWRLLPRRQALLLELVQLGAQHRIEAWGGLELVGDVLGNVLGVARGTSKKDEQGCHRCVRSAVRRK